MSKWETKETRLEEASLNEARDHIASLKDALAGREMVIKQMHGELMEARAQILEVETTETFTLKRIEALEHDLAAIKQLNAENERLHEALEKIAFTSLLTGAQAHDIAIEALGEQIAVEVPDDDDGRQARAMLAKEAQ